MAQILVYAKQTHNSYKDLKEDKVPETRKGFNLKCKTIGIWGLENIETKVAKLALGFEINVIAYDRETKKIDGVKQYSLEELLENKAISAYVGTHREDSNKLLKHENVITNVC